MPLPRVCFALALSACSGKNDEPPPPPLPPTIADAGIDGITAIVAFDPASGMHLDEDGPNKPPTAKRPRGPSTPIGITLKSDPSGATVFVDGENLGQTPKYWSGVADGSEHEFAFTKPDYALARYRFVPITSGVLHATLERVSSGETIDAGLEPIIAPKFAPDAAVAPPPTVLTDAPVAPPKVDAGNEVDAPPARPTGDAAPASPGPQP